VNYTVGAVTTGCQFGVQHTGGGSADYIVGGTCTASVWVTGYNNSLYSAAGLQAMGRISGGKGMAIIRGKVVASGDGDFSIVATKITDSTLSINIGTFSTLTKVA